MDVRVTFSVSGAAAHIKGTTYDMVVLLAGRDPAAELRKTAQEWEQQAARLMKRAERAELAAFHIEGKNRAALS
jgi:hypothetical protein